MDKNGPFSESEHNLSTNSGIKLCKCGCGKPAPIATHTRKRRGVVKGEPAWFIKGHQGRKPANGAVILPGGKTVVLTLEDKKGNTYHCFVNTEDYAVVEKYRWRAAKSERVFCAVSGSSRRVYMHRLLLPDAEEVDHRDGNGLNNRRRNLRSATHVQNTRNTRAHIGRSSKYKGVHRRSGRWCVQIMVNGVTRRVGMFDSEIIAARAYDAQATKLHGEFARLNFPTEGL